MEKAKAEGSPIKALYLLLPNALNQPALKPIPVAVVAVKSPGIFRVAFGPKINPAGLIKNKLELPPVI